MRQCAGNAAAAAAHKFAKRDAVDKSAGDRWTVLTKRRLLSSLLLAVPEDFFVFTIRAATNNTERYIAELDGAAAAAAQRTEPQKELWQLVFNYITRGAAAKELRKSSHTQALIYLAIDYVSHLHHTYWCMSAHYTRCCIIVDIGTTLAVIFITGSYQRILYTLLYCLAFRCTRLKCSLVLAVIISNGLTNC
jgi:hypothetical protein